MLYRLLVNYMRVKMFRYILARFVTKGAAGKVAGAKGLNTLSISSFLLEFFMSQVLSGKKKVK